jgi:hypothetical protein
METDMMLFLAMFEFPFIVDADMQILKIGSLLSLAVTDREC